MEFKLDPRLKKTQTLVSITCRIFKTFITRIQETLGLVPIMQNMSIFATIIKFTNMTYKRNLFFLIVNY